MIPLALSSKFIALDSCFFRLCLCYNKYYSRKSIKDGLLEFDLYHQQWS